MSGPVMHIEEDDRPTQAFDDPITHVLNEDGKVVAAKPRDNVAEPSTTDTEEANGE